MNGPPLIERAILEHLRLRPGASVGQLSEQFELASSTIVSALARLQEKQLVTRAESPGTGADPVKRTRGRPTLNYQPLLPGPVAAFLFDGSLLAGAVLDSQGCVLAEQSHDLVTVDTRRQAVRLVEEMLLNLLASANLSHRSLAFIALTLNAVRTAHGTVSSSVLPWVTDNFDKAFFAPFSTPVRLVGNTLLQAEYQHLEEPLPACMLQLSFSDGVSCHSILHGNVSTGANALSGELGHVTVDPRGRLCGCGRKGCLETICSGPAIIRSALEALQQQKSSIDERILRVSPAPVALQFIWRAWKERDPVARAVMEPVLDRMAWGLSLAVNLHDPDIVRLRGYVLQDRRAWVDQLARRVKPLLIHGEKRKLRMEPARASLRDVLRTSAFLALREHPQTR